LLCHNGGRQKTEIKLLEEIGVLYRGIVLGLVIAAPVGPVGLLCIRRTLQKGTLVGLATGLGAAFADAVFGAIAVLGVSAVLDFIHHYEASIRLAGGALVLLTAWHTWHDRPKPPQPTELVTKVLNLAPERSLMGTLRAGISGLVITMTNPLTLFGTLAVVATFGGITRKLEADVLVAGIFSGSALWWLFLSGGVGLLRRHFTEARIITVNRITAIALACLAGLAIFSGIEGYMR
jgi:threonine/homoserine/homoserine lactone efflux protein